MSSLVPGFFDSHGWGFGVSVITRRDDIAAVPGRYGWDGGMGTSWYSDPRENMLTILMTPCFFASPNPPNVSFWTLAYQAIQQDAEDVLLEVFMAAFKIDTLQVLPAEQ